MIFIDCNNISINKINDLENMIIENNLKNKVIINYQKKYKSKNITIKKISNKNKYINIIKKATVVFLCNTKNITEVIKYNEKSFIISDFCKGNYENYYNVTLNEIPKVIKDFERKIKNKKSSKKTKRNIKKEKVENKKQKVKKEHKKIFFNTFKIFTIILLIILIIFLGFLVYKKISSDIFFNKKKVVAKKIDYKNENYVFVGDSITYLYNVDKYFSGIPVVNNSTCGYTTDDIYNRLNDFVYKYNPTKVILLIGTNDLVSKDDNYIINRITDIIIEIRKNRPNAKIYLESIYPVNDTNNDKINHDIVNSRDNDRIKNINKELEKLCYSGNCEYINMYDLLADEKGNLKLKYTKEGLHISKEGYEVITKRIKEVLKKE